MAADWDDVQGDREAVPKLQNNGFLDYFSICDATFHNCCFLVGSSIGKGSQDLIPQNQTLSLFVLRTAEVLGFSPPL